MQRMLVFCCLLSILPARVFGASACTELEFYKSGQNIDKFLQQETLLCETSGDGDEIRLSPFDVAVSGYECYGNYAAAKAILDKKPELATSFSQKYKYDNNVPLLATVITYCCANETIRSKAKGACPKGQKSKIAELLVLNGADVNALVDFTFWRKDEEAPNGHSLLDFVRYFPTTSRCAKTSDKSECKKIEQILLEHGAKTTKELQAEPVVAPQPEIEVQAEPESIPEVREAPVVTDSVQIDAPKPAPEPIVVPEPEPIPIPEPETPVVAKTIPEAESIPITVTPVVVPPINVPEQMIETPTPVQIPKVEQAQPETTETEETTTEKPTPDSPMVADETLLQKDSDKTKQKTSVYELTKSAEQSLGARTLTALTTVATGIGGMELAQGLTEQSADRAAAQDMAAYIETMRCTYADGQSVKAGLEEIELPGANNQTLMSLRGEYLALADDLKTRKNAMGLKPGIESEEILDRANSGLYDDESIGISSGTYESLYRANMLNSEQDQEKINQNQAASKRRVIGGGIAAGAGVVAGIAGSAVINKKLKNKIKDIENPKSQNTKNKNVVDKLKKGLKSSGMKNVDALDFGNLDLSALGDIINKLDFQSMINISDKDATTVLDTTNSDSFSESFGAILGDKNTALFDQL